MLAVVHDIVGKFDIDLRRQDNIADSSYHIGVINFLDCIFMED